MALGGLSQINIELTSRCDKYTLCGFCGHQNPAVHPTLKFGDLSETLLGRLASDLAPLGRSLVVQFHRDGDPLAAPPDLLENALYYLDAHIRSIVTHGERLGALAKRLIGHCETVCVSIFRGDPDRPLQVEALRLFLAQKGDRLPRVVLKVVGDMSHDDLQPYLVFGLPLLRRRLHVPVSNARYAGGLPAMPEHGLCLDLLHHPSVAWDGRVYLCNRLDTQDRGLIGNLNEESLDAIWNGKLRQDYLQKHLDGRRADVPPCADCQYYGIPAT